jgi:hypothetical protein
MKLDFIYIQLIMIMKSILFGLLVTVFLLLTIITKYFLISDMLYFNSLAEQLSYEQIQELLASGEKWAWLGYALIPVIYAIKCSLVALCLGLGCFFITNRFEFKKLFGVAVAAEFVFLIPAVGKLLWFLFIQTDYTLEDLQFFYPLSALSLFDYHTVQPWLLYPLQVLNVFELIYWMVLAYGLSQVLPRPDLSRAMSVVLSSYGTGLVIWVAVVMFLTLTYGA